MTNQETENRITFYEVVSRLMIIEIESSFLKIIHENQPLLELFPNYATWTKRDELSEEALIENYYNADFANLFLMHLVPYESFYTREDQMIESGGDNPVVTLYNALNFRVELDKARVVSPDHIGVELEFMSVLCRAQQKAQVAEDDEGVIELLKIQKGFLKDHLLDWAPMFLINMRSQAQTPLYFDAAGLALEFLLEDYENLCSKLATYEE